MRLVNQCGSRFDTNLAHLATHVLVSVAGLQCKLFRAHTSHAVPALGGPGTSTQRHRDLSPWVGNGPAPNTLSQLMLRVITCIIVTVVIDG